VELTVASGAHGIGFTNWLDRVGPTFFKDTLSGLSHIRSEGPPVAILTPYRSYYAFKGMGYVAPGKRDPRDPVQDDLFACLDAVQAAVPALGGLQIFGVPRMLLTVLQHFEQVFYLSRACCCLPTRAASSGCRGVRQSCASPSAAACHGRRSRS
jgi:hypothetical protein